ncbi:MAG: hypothetical protein ABL895_18395 [Cyclobacteriaceae bacterium]
MKYPIAAFCLFLICYPGYSQTPFKQAVFVEGGGNAYWYSVNYERQGAKGFVGRVGIGYYDQLLVVPVTVGKVFGNKSHHFELTGGLDLVNNSQTDALNPAKRKLVALTTFLGYRYQHPEHRFFARGGFTPIWTFYSSSSKDDMPGRVFPWFGVSVGYRLR